MHDDKFLNAPFYGTYKVAADAPTPILNSPMYPPVQYSTYDPNWRGFIGYIHMYLAEQGLTLVDYS